MNYTARSSVHSFVVALAITLGILAAIGIAVCLTLDFFTPYLMKLVVSSYERTIGTFANKSFDEGTFPYVYTTVFGVVFGVVVTIAAVVLTVITTRRENRKQATIKIMLDARISEYFQNKLALVDQYFPPGEKASLKKFRSYRNSTKKKDQEIAAAVVQVLNFHEFIAAGAMHMKLDNTMVRETIRGLQCRLAFDMRDIIRDFRKPKKQGDESQKKNLINLVAFYWKWVDEDNEDEYDKALALRTKKQYLGPYNPCTLPW